jgi:hypothetical protein
MKPKPTDAVNEENTKVRQKTKALLSSLQKTLILITKATSTTKRR